MGGDDTKKKGFRVALFVAGTLLITMCSCRAASSKINDSHSRHCSSDDDNREECLLIIGEEEFSMESEISRRLLQQTSGGGVTGGAGNPNQPAVACGNPRYDACLPDPNAPPANGPNCGIYNRECPR